ncbi:MAG: hypothetical protein KAS12_01310 [Candidatus Aenigmarchaeota archaeon]|nr:hypothetical protein [Candidatus Aenigmarchaeota archaeon]
MDTLKIDDIVILEWDCDKYKFAKIRKINNKSCSAVLIRSICEKEKIEFTDSREEIRKITPGYDTVFGISIFSNMGFRLPKNTRENILDLPKRDQKWKIIDPNLGIEEINYQTKIDHELKLITTRDVWIYEIVCPTPGVEISRIKTVDTGE